LRGSRPEIAGRRNIGTKRPAIIGILVMAGHAPEHARARAHGSRSRWVTAVLGLGILATFPLRIAVGTSASWHAFATWLVR